MGTNKSMTISWDAVISFVSFTIASHTDFFAALSCILFSLHFFTVVTIVFPATKHCVTS